MIEVHVGSLLQLRVGLPQEFDATNLHTSSNLRYQLHPKLQPGAIEATLFNSEQAYSKSCLLLPNLSSSSLLWSSQYDLDVVQFPSTNQANVSQCPWAYFPSMSSDPATLD